MMDRMNGLILVLPDAGMDLIILFFLRYVGRAPSASVATGSKASHNSEEKSLLEEAFKHVL